MYICCSQVEAILKCLMHPVKDTTLLVDWYKRASEGCVLQAQCPQPCNASKRNELVFIICEKLENLHTHISFLDW